MDLDANFRQIRADIAAEAELPQRLGTVILNSDIRGWRLMTPAKTLK
jgi:hypothetical protein